MAGRRFDVADVVEVLLRWQAGQSARWIARSLGMGRDRVRAIVCAFRLKPDTDSDAKRTVIPIESGHAFRSKADKS